MRSLDNATLPRNVRAERMILGSLLAGHVSLDLIASTLAGDDFSDETHRRIYSRIVDLFERGEAVNNITVMQELQRAQQLESVGGLTYLVELESDSVPVNLDSYIRIVKDKSVLRRTIFACQGVIDQCMTEADDAAHVVASAEDILAKIGDSSRKESRLRTPGEVIEECGKAFYEPHRNVQGVLWPWPSLNEIIPALEPDNLILLAARPSVGKSAAAGQLAQHASFVQQKGTMLFSAEMSAGSILTRMACFMADVDGRKHRGGWLNREERARFSAAAEKLKGCKKLWIDDTAGCTVPAIQSAIRKKRATDQVDIVLIDYLQLLEAPGRENRNQEVSSISRGLKLTAKEFKIPVVALSQLSRMSETNDRPPGLTDLRDSGSLEQDADIVVFLHPKTKDLEQSIVEVQFLVAKQRAGTTGVKTFTFYKPVSRFSDPKDIPDQETA
jgi:replicative DNA helicase